MKTKVKKNGKLVLEISRMHKGYRLDRIPINRKDSVNIPGEPFTDSEVNYILDEMAKSSDLRWDTFWKKTLSKVNKRRRN